LGPDRQDGPKPQLAEQGHEVEEALLRAAGLAEAVGGPRPPRPKAHQLPAPLRDLSPPENGGPARAARAWYALRAGSPSRAGYDLLDDVEPDQPAPRFRQPAVD